MPRLAAVAIALFVSCAVASSAEEAEVCLLQTPTQRFLHNGADTKDVAQALVLEQDDNETSPTTTTTEGCCSDEDASCWACAAHMTVEQYCAQKPTAPGCYCVGCCSGMSAECLACCDHMTVEQWCAQHAPYPLGCPAQR